MGLAFDGTHIWTANYSSNSVSKLRASDGALIGTYNTGTNPMGLAFDGTHIWTANGGSNSVSKLRASDGALIRTYPWDDLLDYSGYKDRPTDLASDGTHIWVINSHGNYVVKICVNEPAPTITVPPTTTLPPVTQDHIDRLDLLTEEMWYIPCTWDWVYSDCYGSDMDWVRSYLILVRIVYGPGSPASSHSGVFDCVLAAREWDLTLSEWRSLGRC
jgi:hypothetical protein